MPIRTIINFLRLEAFSGILLIFASILAILCANSPLNTFYQTALTQYHLNFTVNDSLMVLFFFLVGLEIKREITSGELNSATKILLPAVAALFGMVVPALIYIGLNFHHPELLRGWAIPTATDIAFTLTVLTLLGSRIPLSLKIFLMALAIFDDLGAIIIIAIFYAKHFELTYLLLSLPILLSLIFMGRQKVTERRIYILLGFSLWFCIMHSGIHPTIAGVLVALTIPTEAIPNIEHKLHPWVAYLILPLFAFINMGIPLSHFSWATLLTPIPLGIILGLCVGKFLGIFSSVSIMIKTDLAKLPKDCNWRMMVGASFLCGIGFTMSLFIGDLAFDATQIELVRMGVLVGSILSGIVGYVILRTSSS